MTDRRHLHAVPDQPDVLDPRFRQPRPDLRRPPRDQPSSYVVRAALDHSTPPIWRTLELRSDQTLARVHRVLQAAFGWTYSHLHRFALGGHQGAMLSRIVATVARRRRCTPATAPGESQAETLDPIRMSHLPDLDCRSSRAELPSG